MGVSVQTHNSIKSILAQDWNACAHSSNSLFQPFVDHRFLSALEHSGSVAEETGWSPLHLELKLDDETVGVVPMYLKSHSQGEFVFDHVWAEAYYRAGGNYYPKLQACVPFTPAAGLRMLSKNSATSEAVESQLAHKIVALTNELGVSSAHITFMEERQWTLAHQAGFSQRMDLQFHWMNAGYKSFEEFVSQLASKKGRNIRRERRAIKENDLHIDWLSGSVIEEHHWDTFYEFYLNTSSRKWGRPYLNREFFSRVNTTMSERILLILCRRGSKYIAGALNFIGDQTLYGRYWGCIEHYPFLHFELCYYQAIEYAIQHRLSTVEAGAQGGHKFARGYQAQPTYSVHYLANEHFHTSVANFLAEETKSVHRDLDWLSTQSPYKDNVTLKALDQRVNSNVIV